MVLTHRVGSMATDVGDLGVMFQLNVQPPRGSDDEEIERAVALAARLRRRRGRGGDDGGGRERGLRPRRPRAAGAPGRARAPRRGRQPEHRRRRQRRRARAAALGRRRGRDPARLVPRPGVRQRAGGRPARARGARRPAAGELAELRGRPALDAAGRRHPDLRRRALHRLPRYDRAAGRRGTRSGTGSATPTGSSSPSTRPARACRRPACRRSSASATPARAAGRRSCSSTRAAPTAASSGPRAGWWASRRLTADAGAEADATVTVARPGVRALGYLAGCSNPATSDSPPAVLGGAARLHRDHGELTWPALSTIPRRPRAGARSTSPTRRSDGCERLTTWPGTRRRCGRGWRRTATCSCRACSTARPSAPGGWSC